MSIGMDGLVVEKDGCSEVVVYEGTTFRRYPDSPHLDVRRYFRDCRFRLLHRVIYEDCVGPIPDGMHIHHVDEDTANNEPENLRLVSAVEHNALHWTPERAARQREHAERIRPLAAEWHGTDEGRAWHREHAERMGLGKGPERDFTCERCGEAFKSRKCSNVRFCSNKYRTAARKASGVDNVERECVECGKKFTINRFVATRTCSRSCANRQKHRTEGHRVRSHGGG